MRTLDLAGNRLTVAPDVGENPELRFLDISRNLLSVPPDVHQNFELVEMDLSRNNLTQSPFVGQNCELQSLGLHNNLLEEAPDISQNSKLDVLYLHSNRLTTVPPIPHGIYLVVLNLSHNPLLPEGYDGQWGRRELRGRFGDRVIMTDPGAAPSMSAATSQREVYRHLSAVFPHINFQRFEGLVPPQVPGEPFSPKAMMAALEHMWSRLNLTHQDAPNFVGYEAASNDFSAEGGREEGAAF